jgi:LmbE family N-acetylglucosaminyl deacetylase
MPRALVVVAHPDDETIGLGGRLGRFGDGYFVHVTDGAPRNEEDSRKYGFTALAEYRAALAKELDSVFRAAGIASVSRECLGIADQESAFQLAPLTVWVKDLLGRYHIEIVFTHPYEGGHPDHDACAFAVHHAVSLQRRQGGQSPVIAEAPFYHTGPRGIETGTFLNSDSDEQLAYRLSNEEQKRKEQRLRCFVTQQQTLQPFQLDVERYRIAPEYDFKRPPHEGRVFYDDFSWGMTSGRFCELAREAERTLEQQEVLAACKLC